MKVWRCEASVGLAVGMEAREPLVDTTAGRACTANCGLYVETALISFVTAPIDAPSVLASMTTCPPAQGQLPDAKQQLVLKAYALHAVIAVVAWLASFLFSIFCCGFQFSIDIVGPLLTCLCYLWVVSFAKFPETCCLEPHLNGLLLTVFLGLSTLLALSATSAWWMLASEQPIFWLSGLLWIVDALVLACTTALALVATQDVWPGVPLLPVVSPPHAHQPLVLPAVPIANPVAAE